MKIVKLTVTVIDFDELGEEGIKSAIENANYANRCISPKVISAESRDIGKWTDNHPLNNSKTAFSEYIRLFGGI